MKVLSSAPFASVPLHAGSPCLSNTQVGHVTILLSFISLMGYKRGGQGLLLFNYLPVPIPGNSGPSFG